MSPSRQRLRRLILVGLLSALYIAMDAIPSPAGGFLKFSGFILILSGFLCAPAGGFTVGAIGDLVTYLLRPKGPFFPGFTLTSALTATIPALVSHKRPNSVGWIFLGVALGQGITKLLLVPYFTQIAFRVPFQVTLIKDAYQQLFHIPLYTVGLWAVLARLTTLGVLPDPTDLQDHTSGHNRPGSSSLPENSGP